uniref:Uncharacterized protein n=1 Tax=Athene cunicularia TaxID=194338 RepID=A0A663MQ78_ATHCN
MFLEARLPSHPQYRSSPRGQRPGHELPTCLAQSRGVLGWGLARWVPPEGAPGSAQLPLPHTGMLMAPCGCCFDPRVYGYEWTTPSPGQAALWRGSRDRRLPAGLTDTAPSRKQHGAPGTSTDIAGPGGHGHTPQPGPKAFVLTTPASPPAGTGLAAKPFPASSPSRPPSPPAPLRSPASPQRRSKRAPNPPRNGQGGAAGQAGTLLPWPGCTLGSHETGTGANWKQNKITKSLHKAQSAWKLPVSSVPLSQPSSTAWAQHGPRRRREAAAAPQADPAGPWQLPWPRYGVVAI